MGGASKDTKELRLLNNILQSATMFIQQKCESTGA